jgi:hypothetical protein
MSSSEPIWIKDGDTPYGGDPDDGFACLYRGSKRIAVLDDIARDDLLKNAPDC